MGLALVGLCMSMCTPPTFSADMPVPPLVIREIKITGDEFVVLQATQDIADLSQYWIGYNGSDTATAIVPSQQLPAQKLTAGQAMLMTSDGTMTCDAVLITKLSVSLSDTKGTFVVRQLQTSGATSTFTTVDSVNWSKPAASGSTTDLLDLRKETTTPAYPVWYHGPSFNAPWQVGGLDNCSITFPPAGSTASATSVVWPQNTTDPPSIIQSLEEDDADVATVPTLPTADAGLLPPQITELLPNPAGTGNDGTDEYIELYNPNAAAFDLHGFTLQTGSVTKHSYVFSGQTLIPAKGFTAFYADDTNLSMSNTAGQAALLDPFGSVLSETDPYSNAKDGIAWALAKGTWYWTTQATPSAANVIVQASSTKSTGKTTSTKQKTQSTAAVKGASTAAKSGTVTTVAGAGSDKPQPKIHTGVLAVVVALALGYVLYEYRHDVANYYHRLRGNRTAGRAARA